MAVFLLRLPGRVSRPILNIIAACDTRVLARRRDGRRILLVTNDLSRSGAPRLVVDMATMLKAAGYHPVVLSPLNGPAVGDLLDHDIPVVVRARDRGWSDTAMALAEGAGMAICNTVDTAPIAAALAPRLPTMWYLHEVSLLTKRLHNADVDSALRQTTAIWAGSPVCADIARQLRRDAVTIPYGLTPLPDAPRPSNRFTIGVFGSIEPRKGQDLLVAALARLPEHIRDQLRVEVYGRVIDPSFAAAVQGADDPVLNFHGEVDSSGYAAAIAGVDAVLVCSRDDTLPLVSLDALGLGRMLLLTPTVGTSAYLQDGKDALIATETSAAGVAALIERAVASRAQAKRMGVAARATFQEHFSVERFSEQLLALVAAAAR